MLKKYLFNVILCFVLTLLSCRTSLKSGINPATGSGEVSFTKSSIQGLVTMPYNKIIDPAGKQLYFGDPELESHALDCALSYNGRFLAVEGRYEIVFIDTEKDTILYHLKRDPLLYKEMNTYSGIRWFLRNDTGYVAWSTKSNVMMAGWDGSKARVSKKFFFAAIPPAKASLPNELLIRDDGGTFYMYVVLNGNNQLAKVNIETGEVIWSVETGLAPYGVALARGKLYVSNWAGSKPSETSGATAGIPWGTASVDPVTGAISGGSVSVIRPEDGSVIGEIATGLHPNDLIASPGGSFIYVANGNSDNISVIDTRTGLVSETISVRLQKETNPFMGDTPNGLALSSDGTTLFVANGMDNALGVIHLGLKACKNGKQANSILEGFIPTEAYPGGIALLNDTKIYVANIEAEGARQISNDKSNPYFQTMVNGQKVTTAGYFNSHRMQASVTVIPLPGKEVLAQYTKRVREANQLFRLQITSLLPRKDMKPVPLPQRIGEPSVFKHVVYIIKENRTYDQVLGDIPEGEGAPELCAFGEEVTPNTHKIVREFSLLDHYKVSGKCSAEGHLWTDAAIVTDYIEKNVRAWFRSYTHVLYDAMAYPQTGFIWDNALDHGKTVRIYGEAAIPKWEGKKTWKNIYDNFLEGKPFSFYNTTTIDRVRSLLAPRYPGYDSHNIPDILRAEAFIEELKAAEQQEGDVWPELMIMALPNDHTAGTSPDHPTPRAMVADNDLAFGKIVEAISHSRFWKNTVIFVTEDDSQSGWDHVSAYRTVGLVISPYSRLRQTIHTDYNQTSMIRSIEQILGLPPMNIMDATATPMFSAFTDHADPAPYVSEKNRILLDEMNPSLATLRGHKKRYALQSEKIIQQGIDGGDDDLFNRIIWNATMGKKAYPEGLER